MFSAESPDRAAESSFPTTQVMTTTEFVQYLAAKKPPDRWATADPPRLRRPMVKHPDAGWWVADTRALPGGLQGRRGGAGGGPAWVRRGERGGLRARGGGLMAAVGARLFHGRPPPLREWGKGGVP